MTDPIELAYSLGTYVYLDVETVPVQDPEAVFDIRSQIKPPANLKKQESIDAWFAEHGEQAGADLVAKTSFDGARGHVCTIAWAVNDGPVASCHASSVGDEAGIITAMFSQLPMYKSVIFVGHNIAGFDLPFLRKRAIILGVTLAQQFPRDVKSWDKNIHDTMTMWAGHRDTISMDNLCKALGIPGKSGMDGSQVAQAWTDRRHDEIEQYCRDDVERTRLIHQKFLAVGW